MSNVVVMDVQMERLTDVGNHAIMEDICTTTKMFREEMVDAKIRLTKYNIGRINQLQLSMKTYYDYLEELEDRLDTSMERGLCHILHHAIGSMINSIVSISV